VSPVDRAAFAALWLLAFSIPWQNALVIPGLGTLSRAVGVAALGIGLLAMLTTGSLRRPKAFHLLAIAFALWSALSLAWAIDVTTSLGRVITYAQLAVLVILVWQFARTELRQNGLLQAYVLGSYVLVSSMLFSYVTGEARSGRFTAVGFNADDVAAILALGVPIAWHLARLASSRVQAWLNVAFLPLAVLSVLLTGARGGFLVLLTGLAVIPLSLHELSMKARAGLSLLVASSLVAAFLLVPQQLLARVGGTSEAILEGDFTGRLDIWRVGTDIFLENPIVGIGPGMFQRAAEPVLGARLGRSPHQTFLAVLLELGVVGFVLFGGMMIAALRPIGRMPRGARRFWAVLALALFVALLPISWEYSKTTWLLLALAATASAAPQRHESMGHVPLQARTKHSTNQCFSRERRWIA
jgi:O-antigen ligase